MPVVERDRRWFRIAYAGNALRRMLDEQGTELTTMTARTGIRAMVDFVAGYRPQHGESDALWCSWGRSGDEFEFRVARRMTRHGHPDAEVAIALTYRLTPAREPLTGETEFTGMRDATATDGYHAISGASPLECRIDQR